MANKDLVSQLESLFSEIDPEPEAEEKKDGSLLKETVARLFKCEATIEPIAAEPSIVKAIPIVAPGSEKVREEPQVPPRGAANVLLHKWTIQSQIAEQVSVTYALVLVVLITVILLSVGIAILLSSHITAIF
jgi:hypothetical protein